MPEAPAEMLIRYEGLAGPRLVGLLWHAAPGAPGVVVVHGAGSRKENHLDSCRAANAADLSVLALDLRGHGASGGEPGVGMLDDVHAALDALAGAGAGALGLRGSSLGGFLALHVAARYPGVRAVAAVCPARAQGLAEHFGATWALGMPLTPAVSRTDGVARGYAKSRMGLRPTGRRELLASLTNSLQWHTTGDEVVPWPSTMALASATPPPCYLRIASGGHHRSLQHDPDTLAATVAFFATHLAR